MKLNSNLDSEILRFKQLGFSSRDIANVLGVGKTTVNNRINKLKSEESKSNMRMLFLDVETRPDIAVSFTRFKANMTQDHIIEEGGGLISIAWQFGQHGDLNGMVQTADEAIENDDYELVKTLVDQIEDSDIIVGHNIDQFDLPVIRARAVINGLRPPKLVKTVDTLKIARTMKFQSNKLDSLAQVLGVGEKHRHSGISMWVGCIRGEESSLEEMLKYNLIDVEILVKVYNKIRSFDPKAPNAGLYNPSEELACRVCGSHNVLPTGSTVKTGVASYTEYVCTDCGARSRDRKIVIPSEHRKSLLV